MKANENLENCAIGGGGSQQDSSWDFFVLNFDCKNRSRELRTGRVSCVLQLFDVIDKAH